MNVFNGMFFLSCFLIVFLLSFMIAYNDDGFYKKQFEENDAYEKLGKDEVDNFYIEMREYLDGDGELVSFSGRERLHLADVKDLINLAYWIFYFALGIFILILGFFIAKKEHKFLSKGLIYCGAVIVILVFLIVIISLLDFNWLFTGFHLVSFDNDLWLLPGNSKLIQMFPAAFFFNIFARILTYACLFGLVMILFGYLMKKNILEKEQITGRSFKTKIK